MTLHNIMANSLYDKNTTFPDQSSIRLQYQDSLKTNSKSTTTPKQIGPDYEGAAKKYGHLDLYKTFADPVNKAKPCTTIASDGTIIKLENCTNGIIQVGGKKSRRKTSRKSHRKSSKKSHRKSRRGGKSRRGRR